MCPQKSAKHRGKLEIALCDQPAEIPSAEPVSLSAPAPNLSEELCKKYGFKRREMRVVVITK